MKVIGVIGAGTMGTGIAHTAAKQGFQVLLFDASATAIERALTSVASRLAREVRMQKMTQEQSDRLFYNIRSCPNLSGLKDVDFIIEAATEKIDIKKEIFKKLDSVFERSVVMATNTSGLSVTEIASATSRPENVIGMHFFNPVPVMQLVEIIRGVQTSDETFEMAMQIAHKLGKEPITVKEAPLFVVNRILVPMLNEAIYVLQEGLASKEDIDKGMVLGANHPIGPLSLCDLVGLDTLLHVATTLYEETGDSKYRPAPLLRQMVRAGYLGRKSGRGFYDYSSQD